MDSSKLNSWLTLAANIGVLVGLLLLVVEIRQNTAASQAQTAQAIIDSSRNFLVGIAMDSIFPRKLAVFPERLDSMDPRRSRRPYLVDDKGNHLRDSESAGQLRRMGAASRRAEPRVR